MDEPSLYDRDIYAWAETQASALRRLAETRRDLPNELDVENIAEEIADVGRVRLHRFEDVLEPFFRDLLRLASDPDTHLAHRWATDIRLRHVALVKAWDPTIAPELRLDCEWRTAMMRAAAALDDAGKTLLPGLPAACPFSLDDLLAVPLDIDRLALGLTATSTSAEMIP